MYTMTSKGLVQYWNDGRGVGMIIVGDQGANRLARWLEAAEGKLVSPARIGSVPGETLLSHLNASQQAGATCVYVVKGWNEDGSPIFNVIEPE